MFPAHHAVSSTSTPVSMGFSLCITTEPFIDTLSLSPSTSRVISKVISFAARFSRLSSVTVSQTVMVLESFASRTKSLSPASTRASKMLKKMSEFLSMSALSSWSSGYRLTTVYTRA